MDFAWSPHGIDGRHFDWAGLAAAADLIFLMMYDMQSQVQDSCGRGWCAWGLMLLQTERFPLRRPVPIAPLASFPGDWHDTSAARKTQSFCMANTNNAYAVDSQDSLASHCTTIQLLTSVHFGAQIWGSCVASANTPLALMRRGVDQWLGLGAPANKLVLGLPWWAHHQPATAVTPPPSGVLNDCVAG